MLKFINTRRLRNGTNKNIAIKTFPGAKIEDMTHYVKPTLKKNPKQLIIHIGTNDLSTKSPTQVIQSISALGETIMTEDPSIDLTFSEVVPRSGTSNRTPRGDKTCNIKLRIFNYYC